MARRKAPLVWFDIPVADFAVAERFYGELFGWEFEAIEQPAGEYRLIDAGDDSIDGGLSKRPAGSPASGAGPVFFVHVIDIEATIIRAQRLGGRLVEEPLFMSRDAGVRATVADPDGNIIGLWSAE